MTNIEFIKNLSVLGFVECMPHINLLRGEIGTGEFIKWLYRTADEEFWSKVFK